MSKLSGYKTYMTAALGIVGTIICIVDIFHPGFAIDPQLKESAATGIAFLMAIFLRSGMNKKQT